MTGPPPRPRRRWLVSLFVVALVGAACGTQGRAVIDVVPTVEPSPTPMPWTEADNRRPVPASSTDATLGGYVETFAGAIGASNVEEYVRALIPSLPANLAIPEASVITALRFEQFPLSGSSSLVLEVASAASISDLDDFVIAVLGAEGLELTNRDASTRDDGTETRDLSFAPAGVPGTTTAAGATITAVPGEARRLQVDMHWDHNTGAVGAALLAADVPNLGASALATTFIEATPAGDNRVDVALEWIHRSGRPWPGELAGALPQVVAGLGGDWVSASDSQSFDGFGHDTTIANESLPDERFTLRATGGSDGSALSLRGELQLPIEPFRLPDAESNDEDLPQAPPEFAAVGDLPLVAAIVTPPTETQLATASGLVDAGRAAYGATNVIDHALAFDPTFDAEIPLPDDATLIGLEVIRRFDKGPWTTTTIYVATRASIADLENFFVATVPEAGYPLESIGSTSLAEGTPVVLLTFDEQNRKPGRTSVEISLRTADGFNVAQVMVRTEHDDDSTDRIAGWAAGIVAEPWQPTFALYNARLDDSGQYTVALELRFRRESRLDRTGRATATEVRDRLPWNGFEEIVDERAGATTITLELTHESLGTVVAVAGSNNLQLKASLDIG